MRFSSVLGGGSRRGSPVQDYRDFVGTRPVGQREPLMLPGCLGKCSGVRSPGQKQSATCKSSVLRSDGLDGVGYAGLRTEVTARVISSAPARFCARKWHQMAVGHRLDSFRRRGLRRGRKNIAIGRAQFTAVYQCGHPHLPLAVSPVCSVATEDDPGPRDSRPLFLCEIAPNACPVTSRRWSWQR